MNQADEIRAACREIITLLDCSEIWADAKGKAIWRATIHREVLKLRELTKDHEPSYWDEKAKDRREEFKSEDDLDRQRAYPERREG